MHQPVRSSRSLGAALLALAAAALLAVGCTRPPAAIVTALGATTPTPPVAGCRPALSPPLPLDSLGDPLYPQLGNAGYDVLHYTLDLSANPDAGTLSGTATIDIGAVQDLSAFTLDFHGFSIQGLTVNGAPASYQRNGDKLRVDLPQPVRQGQSFTAAVAYSGTPDPLSGPSVSPQGWIRGASGSYVSAEPAGAQAWFPANDHPCDKATYTFRVTVPKPYTAAANGLLTSTQDNGATTTCVWQSTGPMASYLASVNVGDFVLATEQGPNGLPIRSYFARSVAARAQPAFSHLAEQVATFSSLFGPYPFEAYGVVVVDAGTGGWAMENQTLSLFGRDAAASGQAALVGPHELAHQWFGDSVSLKSWRDIWLNEGFATYAEALWIEQTNGSSALEAHMRGLYPGAGSQALVPPGNPPADDLFNQAVYDRGALTLHALRRQVGDDAFFRILRTYAERYRYGNASTADLIGVAQEVSGQDLGALFQAWLYEPAIPAYPVPQAASLFRAWPRTFPGPFRLPPYRFWMPWNP